MNAEEIRAECDRNILVYNQNVGNYSTDDKWNVLIMIYGALMEIAAQLSDIRHEVRYKR